MWNNLDEFLETLHSKLETQQVFCFRAKITPNAQKTEFVEILEDSERTVKMRLSAVPEKGKANREIIRFFKKTYHVKSKILSGKTQSIKRIQLKK